MFSFQYWLRFQGCDEPGWENKDYPGKDRTGFPAFGQLVITSSIFLCLLLSCHRLLSTKRESQNNYTGELWNMVMIKGKQFSIIFWGTYEVMKFWNLIPVTEPVTTTTIIRQDKFSFLPLSGSGRNYIILICFSYKAVNIILWLIVLLSELNIKWRTL